MQTEKPLMVDDVPTEPRHKVGMDLFHIKAKVDIDYDLNLKMALIPSSTCVIDIHNPFKQYDFKHVTSLLEKGVHVLKQLLKNAATPQTHWVKISTSCQKHFVFLISKFRER